MLRRRQGQSPDKNRAWNRGAAHAGAGKNIRHAFLASPLRACTDAPSSRQPFAATSQEATRAFVSQETATVTKTVWFCYHKYVPVNPLNNPYL